jgi:hypothetical protein
MTASDNKGWFKSSLSFANGNCVEVSLGEEIGVRNSREAAGAVLRFTPGEWDAFIGGVKNGEFNRFGQASVSGGWVKSSESIGNGQCVEVALGAEISVRNSRHSEDGPVLRFTPDEWDAFIGGVKNGEFDRNK